MNKLKGKIILVVDDEELLREVLNEFFTLEGATVIEAGNGSDGFLMLQQNKVDIIISDLRMPNGDGLSLLQNIKTSLNYKPHIFLYSGHADTMSESSAQALGANGYFIKPFSVRDLVDVLAKYN